MTAVAVIAAKSGDSWCGVYVYGDGDLRGVGSAILKAAAGAQGKLKEIVEGHIDAVPGDG